MPAMASTASAPPTPTAAIAIPPALGVCESVLRGKKERKGGRKMRRREGIPNHEAARESVVLEDDLVNDTRSWLPKTIQKQESYNRTRKREKKEEGEGGGEGTRCRSAGPTRRGSQRVHYSH